MSEEPGAFEVVIAIGGAEHISFEGTHPWVEEAIENGGGVVNIRIFGLDFDDGVVEDLFGRQYAKLNSYNTGGMLLVEFHTEGVGWRSGLILGRYLFFWFP
jgi:hypothetical protein